MKNKGRFNNTLITTSQKLSQLGRNTDLMNPQEVLTYIANHKVANSSKQKLVNCYAYFCKTNGIIFEKPKYKCEETIPIIPTKENVFGDTDFLLEELKNVFWVFDNLISYVLFR